MEREQKFGRLLAVSNVLGMRVFDKGKPAPAHTYLDRFGRKPTSTFQLIHKDIMECAHKFKEPEMTLMSRLDEIMSSFEYGELDNEPLESCYLQQFNSYQHNLRKEGF